MRGKISKVSKDDKNRAMKYYTKNYLQCLLNIIVSILK